MSPASRCPGASAVKVAADQIRCRCRGRVRPGQRAGPASGVPGDAAFAHHPLDPFVVDHPPAAAQLGGDPRAAVGAAVGGVDPGDLAGQPVLGRGPLLAGRGGGEPLVEPRAAHAQDSAQPGDTIGAAVGGDEPVAAGQRSISCAK